MMRAIPSNGTPILLSTIAKVITPAAFTMEIKDRAEVSKLASFFPKMQEQRISGSRPWWNPAATIIFYRSNDTAVVVNVSSDMRNWVSDVSQGDWPVQGDLREFLSELKNKAQANSFPMFLQAAFTCMSNESKLSISQKPQLETSTSLAYLCSSLTTWR